MSDDQAVEQPATAQGIDKPAEQPKAGGARFIGAQPAEGGGWRAREAAKGRPVGPVGGSEARGGSSGQSRPGESRSGGGGGSGGQSRSGGGSAGGSSGSTVTPRRGGPPPPVPSLVRPPSGPQGAVERPLSLGPLCGGPVLVQPRFVCGVKK
jgi:hypothetical protein